MTKTVASYEVRRTYVRFHCPSCKEVINTELVDAGKHDACPVCCVAFVSPGLVELNRKAEQEAATRLAHLELKANKDKQFQESLRRKRELAEAKAAEKSAIQFVKVNVNLQQDEIGIEPPTSKRCPFCAELIQPSAVKCRFCGEFLVTHPCRNDKNRFVAALLAFLFGCLGVHKFYTGHSALGIVYLLFIWAFPINAVVALCEAFGYLVMSEDGFARHCNRLSARAPVLPVQPPAIPSGPIKSWSFKFGFGILVCALFAIGAMLLTVAEITRRNVQRNPIEVSPVDRATALQAVVDRVDESLSADLFGSVTTKERTATVRVNAEFFVRLAPATRRLCAEKLIASWDGERVELRTQDGSLAASATKSGDYVESLLTNTYVPDADLR